ncbi:hypothetical protein B5E92_04840 [Erysipelatoclostridium sp. An15]|uniref:MurR/RpiR family transcriptional regulator n=1 Tax=Erysipelatoclostridium sp. An15 TaxID=1965566 RepID=UPI000B395B78|nr:MurR/RpiR family transcriptional regulator [Erysipelatoclostridium sp. An15]OUQ08205.1 hypothetical protein B5E92_04840 [Erysipelatoclostridium sp. An15]
MSLLKRLYIQENFTEREKMISDYIVENSEEVVNMSSRELARKTLTNSTTIIRFIKKLGYHSYNDFKVNLLYDLKNEIYSKEDLCLDKQENIYTILNKLTSLHERVIFETKKNMNIENIIKISKILNESHEINFFATDANKAIAEYVSHNLFLIGKKSNVYSSMDKILLYNNVSHEDLSSIIVITRQGQDKNIARAMLELKKSGIKTISICSNENSLIVKRADFFIKASYIEGVKEFGEMIYGISVHYILDVLLSLIAANDLEKAVSIYNENDKKYED